MNDKKFGVGLDSGEDSGEELSAGSGGEKCDNVHSEKEKCGKGGGTSLLGRGRALYRPKQDPRFAALQNAQKYVAQRVSGDLELFSAPIQHYIVMKVTQGYFDIVAPQSEFTRRLAVDITSGSDEMRGVLRDSSDLILELDRVVSAVFQSYKIARGLISSLPPEENLTKNFASQIRMILDKMINILAPFVKGSGSLVSLTPSSSPDQFSLPPREYVDYVLDYIDRMVKLHTALTVEGLVDLRRIKPSKSEHILRLLAEINALMLGLKFNLSEFQRPQLTCLFEGMQLESYLEEVKGDLRSVYKEVFEYGNRRQGTGLTGIFKSRVPHPDPDRLRESALKSCIRKIRGLMFYMEHRTRS